MTSNLLLVGNGRLAKHLQKALNLQMDQGPKKPTSPNGPGQVSYFPNTSLKTTLKTWSRKDGESELLRLLKTADVVLLAISDSAIEPFYKDHREAAPQAQWIHFSGALNVEGVADLHPLMTFGPTLYTEDVYRQIPFVSASLKSWPKGFELSNPLHSIHADQKTKYHALCVLGGNFSNLLWKKTIEGLKELGLPNDIARLYAEQNLQNVFADPKNALTGPLVRGDLVTQSKNLEALGQDPFADVYRSFQKAYQL